LKLNSSRYLPDTRKQIEFKDEGEANVCNSRNRKSELSNEKKTINERRGMGWSKLVLNPCSAQVSKEKIIGHYLNF
jgi:hypothetical protein